MSLVQHEIKQFLDKYGSGSIDFISLFVHNNDTDWAGRFCEDWQTSSSSLLPQVHTYTKSREFASEVIIKLQVDC